MSLSRSARAFIAWFGPRGLNSLLFALLVVLADLPGSGRLFAATGAVVAVSVIVHGGSATPLVGWYARKVESETLAEERESTAAGLFVSTPDEVERITAEVLHELMQSPDPPVVLDVRSRSQYERDDAQIPGSVRLVPDEVVSWADTQDEPGFVVPYCT